MTKKIAGVLESQFVLLLNEILGLITSFPCGFLEVFVIYADSSGLLGFEA